MKIPGSSKIHSLILVSALSSGLAFVSPVSAQVGVGYVYYVPTQGRSYIVDSSGKGLTDLGTLSGGSYTVASGINDAGQVVGESSGTANNYHAFITGPNGVDMTDLGPLGFNVSTAYGINKAGQVVGYSTTPNGYHAFITGSNGVGMTDLGTLGGNYSTALGINNAGQVVGHYYTANGYQHAFITGPNGVNMTDLGSLGGNRSVAIGINDAGQVVGYSETGTGVQHAFITGPNGVSMTDVNSLVSLPDGQFLIAATAINNRGQITVIAIPEPETYAMLLAGLALLGFMMRQQKFVKPSAPKRKIA